MDNTRLNIIMTGGLLGVTVCVGMVAMSIGVMADDVVDEINITVPMACTMGGTIVEGQEHTTSLQPGTYQANIGKTTLTTYCNDPEGFSIYAIGFTGDQYSGENHTKLVGNTATNTISTGLTTGSSTTDASSWAMKLTAVSGTYTPTIMNGTGGTENFTSYHVVPDTYTKVATFPSTTDAEGVGSIGSSLETTYAVYASLTQPADTYTGKVKYTLVHPATESAPLYPETTETGKICYYPNGSNVVGTMGCQDIASLVTLLASNFSRTGYGFAGWNTEFDYSGTFYGPNETITLNTADYTGDNNGLSLYAVWVKSVGSLQDSSKVAQLCGTGGTGGSLITAPIDGTANLSSVSALTDQRDNNTYAIAKLADGKCWMIENMRLDNTNGDNSTGALAQGYGTSTTYGNFSGLADPEAPWTTSSSYTTANSLYYSGTQDGTASIDIGTTNRPAYRFPRYNNQNTSDRASIPAIGTNTYSYGNYYTWAAAMANTDNLTSSSTSEAANTSLCPASWTLPTSGSDDKDFAMLYANLSSTPANIRRYPNNFLYSGFVFGSSVSYKVSRGGYWSKSASSYGSAYDLHFDSSNVYPSISDNKNHGFSVRCLAQ